MVATNDGIKHSIRQAIVQQAAGTAGVALREQYVKHDLSDQETIILVAAITFSVCFELAAGDAEDMRKIADEIDLMCGSTITGYENGEFRPPVNH